MNGRAKKKICLWATKVWDATPEEQRLQFNNFEHFMNQVKSRWKTDVKFKTFLSHTNKEGLVS